MTIKTASTQNGFLARDMAKVDGLTFYVHTKEDASPPEPEWPRLVKLGLVQEVRPIYNQVALLIIAAGLGGLGGATVPSWMPGFYEMEEGLTLEKVLLLAASGGDCPLAQAIGANVIYGRWPNGMLSVSGMKSATQALETLGSLCYAGWSKFKPVDASFSRSMVLRAYEGMKMLKRAGIQFPSEQRVKDFLELIGTANGVFLSGKTEEANFMA